MAAFDFTKAVDADKLNDELAAQAKLSTKLSSGITPFSVSFTDTTVSISIPDEVVMARAITRADLQAVVTAHVKGATKLDARAQAIAAIDAATNLNDLKAILRQIVNRS